MSDSPFRVRDPFRVRVRGMEARALGYRFSLGVIKIVQNSEWEWLHILVNILNTTEMYILSE